MKKRILLNGMHCAGCVNSVEKALQNVSTVKEVHVNLATDSAQIEYEGDTFPSREVREAIEKAGYEMEEEESEKVTFQVGGMHCTGCSSAVEKAIQRHEGVVSANVNLAAEKAFVEFNNTALTVEDIRKSIEDAGYEVIEHQKKKQIS